MLAKTFHFLITVKVFNKTNEISFLDGGGGNKFHHIFGSIQQKIFENIEMVKRLQFNINS